MNKLISADDIVKRDKKTTLRVWIVDVSTMRAHEGKIVQRWDGKRIEGEAVQAVVNNGRLLAQCAVCGGHEYVSPREKIFFCMSCGNDGSGAARPVEFPSDWAGIEAALIARPIFPGPGLDEVQAVFRSRPVMRGLARNWAQPITLDQLTEENKAYGIGGKQ